MTSVIPHLAVVNLLHSEQPKLYGVLSFGRSECNSVKECLTDGLERVKIWHCTLRYTSIYVLNVSASHFATSKVKGYCKKIHVQQCRWIPL